MIKYIHFIIFGIKTIRDNSVAYAGIFFFGRYSSGRYKSYYVLKNKY